MQSPVYRVKNPPRKTTPMAPRQSFDITKIVHIYSTLVNLTKHVERLGVMIEDKVRKTYRGDRGAKGERGEKGERGATGAAGSAGAKGDKGDRGERGPSGESIDATTMTEYILERVSAGKELLLSEITHAVFLILQKYFDEKLETVRSQMRQISSKAALHGGGSGGGMGTIKFFKFTGDGVTTAFVLPDIPTQEGAAVFAHVNGPRIHNGEFFTVTGKTLTMLQVLNDGDVLDGWIIT